MLFYNFESIDLLIDNNLINNILEEKNKLNNFIISYTNKKQVLLTITNNTVQYLDNISTVKSQDLNFSLNNLKESFQKLDYILNLAKKIENDLNSIIEMHDKNFKNNKNIIKASLIEYNKKNAELIDKVLYFETIFTENIQFINDLYLSISDFKPNKNKVNDIDLLFNKYDKKLDLKNNIEINTEDNNILLVSEKNKKAYLPYYYDEIRTIFSKFPDKYSTYQDVVDDLYTKSLNEYLNEPISRFREAYNLIRNKTHRFYN